MPSEQSGEARFVPNDPAAYVERADFASVARWLTVFVILLAVTTLVLAPIPGATSSRFGGLLLLAVTAFVGWICWRQAWRMIRREVLFAVDRPGVYFGGELGSDPELVPWSDIDAVVLFGRLSTVQQGSEPARAEEIGVLRRPGTPGVPTMEFVAAVDAVVADPNAALARLGHLLPPYIIQPVVHRMVTERELVLFMAFLRSRQLTGRSIDRARLTAAVRRFAPQVPVQDWPDVPSSAGTGSTGGGGLDQLLAAGGYLPLADPAAGAGPPVPPPAPLGPPAGVALPGPAVAPAGKPGPLAGWAMRSFAGTPWSPTAPGQPAPQGQPATPGEPSPGQPPTLGQSAVPGQPAAPGQPAPGEPVMPVRPVSGQPAVPGPAGPAPAGPVAPGAPWPGSRRARVLLQRPGASYRAVKVSPAGCLGWLVLVPAAWLLFALLPASLLDDQLGHLLHVRWTLWLDHPTEVSVPPGTRLAVEIRAVDVGSAGQLPELQQVACSTRDGDGPPTQLPVQTISVVSHGRKVTTTPYLFDTGTGRLSVHCTWSGSHHPALVRAGAGWFSWLARAGQLLWIGLVTAGMVALNRRRRRQRRRRAAAEAG